MRNTEEGAKPPLRYSLNLSAHFRVWVTVWVKVDPPPDPRIKSTEKQRKSPVFSQKQDFLELLGRFELPTSSLPILPQLFFLILSCFVLKTETLAPQGFQSFLFCVLVSPILRLRMGFFDTRMGFVWVLQRSIIPSISNASNAFVLTHFIAF